jgi:hypothetical protein
MTGSLHAVRINTGLMNKRAKFLDRKTRLLNRKAALLYAKARPADDSFTFGTVHKVNPKGNRIPVCRKRWSG